MPKRLTLWITTNWKILKDNPTYLLRNLCAGQEATVKTRRGTMDCFKQGKEYIKAVYCHPLYLTYMQSTSSEMLGWMNHKLESRLPGEISITSDMQMTPPLWQKCKRAKWLSDEALQIAQKKQKLEAKEKRKDIPFECRVRKNSKEREESLSQ